MTWIHKTPDTRRKLSILSKDSQYDLACSCGVRDDHRRRSQEDKWVYPVALPRGGRVFLFKTLMSNVCTNDCRYCPLRKGLDQPRCTIEPEELSRAFMRYYTAGKVMGLFLTSGVIRDPDTTMERINRTAAILRRQQFEGYVHLKVIPGASDAAIEDAVSLASAVSVNIETAGERHFRTLTRSKDYLRDIIRPITLISSLTSKGLRYRSVKQTTQFVVGAADETDEEIVKYMWGLYRRLGLSRVYFSAYQRGLGEPDLPGERSGLTNADILTREHRLYQVDWLIRRYGFTEDEIPYEENHNLSLSVDPKELWARRHPDFFPVDINRADRHALLRVPGFGPLTVKSILERRTDGQRIRSIGELGSHGKRLRRAERYVRF